MLAASSRGVFIQHSTHGKSILADWPLDFQYHRYNRFLRAAMTKKKSAGLLMYRIRDHRIEVLLVHPGGPFWAKKDVGAWFVPKGEIAEGEDAFTAAKREFQEETGLTPEGPFIDLGEVRHKSGKTVRAWAFEGDCDPAAIRSNKFSMEWPPKSGKQATFPEIDRAQFFGVAEAREKLLPTEFPFIERLHVHFR